MKSDLNLILNKLVSYALDNLLLDALDVTYTFNRLASACGAAAPVLDEDADYGDSTLCALLDELAAAAPGTDTTAIADILFPMPRTVNYYFDSKLSRDTEKAFDFLFDLYAHGANCISTAPAMGKNGYLGYYSDIAYAAQGAQLSVGEELVYTPRAAGNRIATLENPDILSDDLVTRMATYVAQYGGAIAAKIGDATDYMCCKDIAPTCAPVKNQLSTGTIKTALLDYPVPALAFNGIAKNAVAREVARVIKAASEAGYACTLAASAKDGLTFYVVFAGDIAANEYLMGSDALTACGVFRTADCSPLLSVLEKGTALSTDLARFKTIYDKIGGVKLGAKAQAELGGALADMFIPALKAAASVTEEQAAALIAK